MTLIDMLFEEFVASWTHDGALDTDRLLERAGPQAEELARLIDAFLLRAPRRAPSPQSKEAVAALIKRLEQEPPLVSARVAARRRVRDVTQALLAACGLSTEADELVRSYYQRLEGGLLDPTGVSDRIWDALEKLIGSNVRSLAEAGFSSPHQRLRQQASPVFQRLAAADFQVDRIAVEKAEPPSVSDDVRHQVERLFTGHSAD